MFFRDCILEWNSYLWIKYAKWSTAASGEVRISISLSLLQKSFSHALFQMTKLWDNGVMFDIYNLHWKRTTRNSSERSCLLLCRSSSDKAISLIVLSCKIKRLKINFDNSNSGIEVCTVPEVADTYFLATAKKSCICFERIAELHCRVARQLFSLKRHCSLCTLNTQNTHFKWQHFAYHILTLTRKLENKVIWQAL